MPHPLVAFTGAGVSTASGIPDFRSNGGVWDRFDPMEFAIDRFYEDPDRFWQRRAKLIGAMDYLGAKPNTGHQVLAEAARRGDVACVVTQNVDGLHAAAGTPADRLIEVHGNGAWCICVGCGEREETRHVLARLAGPDAPAPRCGACAGLLKPDVVLFGEAVPRMAEAAVAVAQAGTLVVAGTSLQVYPAAGLVDHALAGGADVVILNRDPTPYDGAAKLVRRGPVDEELARLLV